MIIQQQQQQQSKEEEEDTNYLQLLPIHSPFVWEEGMQVVHLSLLWFISDAAKLTQSALGVQGLLLLHSLCAEQTLGRGGKSEISSLIHLD